MLFISKFVHVHCFVGGRVIRTGHPNYLHFVTCQINYDPPPPCEEERANCFDAVRLSFRFRHPAYQIKDLILYLKMKMFQD